MGNKTLIFMVLWYMVMVITFMILYCTFYTSVEGNPGAGELSVNQELTNTNLKLALNITYVVMGLYYLYFFISFCSNLARIMS